MRLLSVDWDSFFVRPDELPGASGETIMQYDWGHRENTLFIHALWPARAASFLCRDQPLPQVNEEWKTFWQRVRVRSRATLYYAESHSQALSNRVFRNVTEVWNFDAHHDCGYGRAKEAMRTGRWDCGSWGYLYREIGAPFHVRYPPWHVHALKRESAPEAEGVDRQIDDGSVPPVTFDRIFLCRSGAWVPSWCDQQFEQFRVLAPATRQRCLDEDGLPPRSLNMEAVEQHAAPLRARLAEWRGAQASKPVAAGD